MKWCCCWWCCKPETCIIDPNRKFTTINNILCAPHNDNDNDNLHPTDETQSHRESVFVQRGNKIGSSTDDPSLFIKNHGDKSMISLNSIEDLELSRTIGKSAQSGDCKDGIQCRNAKCEYSHPTEWDACEDGVDCKAYYCRANHPYDRRNPCPNGRECQASTCNYLHPLPEMEECPTGARCGQCDKGNTCRNIYCKSLHPIGWNPCKTSIKCTDPAYSYTSHPTDRNLSTNEEVFSKTPSVPRLLKSVEQRNREREKAQLPILTCKDEFCQRLKEERILVVIAESGSGKTTQLPQYAAEYFGGLIVCTQPRVVAATSLAHRVANEYDGTSVGRSVGYRVGITNIISRTNRVPGTDILFMTDGALIQDSTEDRQLTGIRILIIDEAHERSLNTDIVMGIAKLLLKSRPTDFYVVISSATIKCDKFLDFFERPDSKPLNVSGRVYEVDLHYLPPNNVPIEQHAVSTLQRLYHQNEGTTLVFLPGQREIERAIELFKHNLPDNCVPLPLYAALSADEQDQVLQFDEGPNGERRMVVFCTNIAETSLTIKNTRLVIDSGLCKEPFVDKEVGSTMIEVNKISRASAHQRRGRAGRTAPGCCIRLYNEQELIRPDIEPAIFRSSLNLIILQLIHLQLNPLEFPFIDPPDPATIKTSLKLLKDLDAIDVNYNITLRGELFVKLNLDPRFCAFLVDTYIDHGPLLELTTTITAILTAPGSLFLIPTNDEEKAMIQNRVAGGAQKYNSDLFYFASIYKQWCDAGETIDLVTRKCRVCHTVWDRGNICRSCQAAYSTTHLLNNKILNTVESVYNASIETIKKPRWQLNPRLVPQANESDIIGTNLYKYFPEYCGYLISPSWPSNGVKMRASKIKAHIVDTSAFIRSSVDHHYFIAMSIIKLSWGKYLIDRLHPCRPPEDLDLEDDEDYDSI